MLNNLGKVWKILTKKNKVNFLFLIILFTIVSFLEVLGIGLVIPFITTIFSPESLLQIEFFKDYEDIIVGDKTNILAFFCLAFLSIFLIKNIIYIWSLNKVFSFNQNLLADLSKKILKKYFLQDYTFFSKKSQGKLSTVLGTEVHNFCSVFMDACLIIVSELIILIALVLLIILSGTIEAFYVLLPCAIIIGLIIHYLDRKIKAKGKERVHLSQETSTLAQRIYLSIRDIYFSNNADLIIDNYYLLIRSQSRINIFLQTLGLFPKALLEIFGIAILLLSVLYLNYIGNAGNDIITTIGFYFVIAYRLIPSCNKILVQLQRIKYTNNSIDNLWAILDLSNSRILSISTDKKINFSKSLKFEKYSFSYDEDFKILNDIDLEIKKGERIGIYGESGSGKSTFLNLLTMLIKPSSGKFYIDDQIIDTQEKIRLYQNKITFISQDTFLFEDSIKNNIILNNNDNFDEKKFNYALQFSQLKDIINKFEKGTDYKVGSHSRKISSGQRQRIVLARAIYNAKDILVLDEATNALDEENETKIFENLHKLDKELTIIIVSHNIKNLKKCDKILEVKNKVLNIKNN